MTEATTRGVPSHPLRTLIARALKEGHRLLEDATGYSGLVHVIAVAFEREMEPLHLADAEYRDAVAACGLKVLLDRTHRMATTLEEAVAAV
jgi:hypothetical protein